MIDCDKRPGRPPDGTVCGDRRSCGAALSGWGRRPALTDAELVCLPVAEVLLGVHSEHRRIRFAYCRLGHLFRYLPGQPGCHKRLRAASPLLAAAISHPARSSPSCATRCGCWMPPRAVRRVAADGSAATSASSGYGSSGSTTASKASSAWNATQAAPARSVHPHRPAAPRRRRRDLA